MKFAVLRLLAIEARLKVSDDDIQIALKNIEPTESTRESQAVNMILAYDQHAMLDLIEQTGNFRPRDLLLDEIDEIERSPTIAPFLVIVQSSGYGKTKTLLASVRLRQTLNWRILADTRATKICIRHSRCKFHVVLAQGSLHLFPFYKPLLAKERTILSTITHHNSSVAESCLMIPSRRVQFLIAHFLFCLL